MKQYIVDAFTETLFKGNQAAVCILDEWLDDNLMLNIAMENNLSETAFIVKEDKIYNLRWFTPTDEIDFCGHATLASAFVIFNYIDTLCSNLTFNTQVGKITVNRNEKLYEMTFPRLDYKKIEITPEIEKCFSAKASEAYTNRDLLLVFENEEDIYNMEIDFESLKKLDAACIAITSKSLEYDCTSRVFAPSIGITEDPVTGSTHCMISSYWSERLGKNRITAYQASRRSGILECEVLEDNVKISGSAVLYSESEIHI